MSGKILVVELEVSDDRTRRDAMKIVAGIIGIHSVDFGDGSHKKLTVWCGKADPFVVVKKLRKLVRTSVISVGPPKVEEPPKKEKVEKKVFTEDEVNKLVQETRVQEIANFMHSYGAPNTYFSNNYVEEAQPGCTIF